MISTEMTSREVTAEFARRMRIAVLSATGDAGGDSAEIVVHDLLGPSLDPIPKQAKQYCQVFNENLAGLFPDLTPRRNCGIL